MDIQFENRRPQARLHLRGRFDFGAHRAFRDAYDRALREPETTEVVVDMTEVSYVDSSALGMLLILRDRAGAAGRSVALAGANGVVAEVLRVANFERLFKLS